MSRFLLLIRRAFSYFVDTTQRAKSNVASNLKPMAGISLTVQGFSNISSAVRHATPDSALPLFSPLAHYSQWENTYQIWAIGSRACLAILALEPYRSPLVACFAGSTRSKSRKKGNVVCFHRQKLLQSLQHLTDGSRSIHLSDNTRLTFMVPG
jgi:hypothetical protein